MNIHLPVFLLMSVVLPAQAQDTGGRAPVEPSSLPAPGQRVPESRPAITRLPDGRMRIGKITFEPTSRRISFPARINMTEGLLEFLLVHQDGKVHESLLVTDLSATHLNIAFKLLKYKASRELYYKMEEDGSLSGEFEEATEEEKERSRVRILIQWKDGDKLRSVPARDWINHATTEKPMPEAPWIYGGSFIYDGRFIAESSGDLIAIFLSNGALINFSGKDNQLDEVWLPHPKRVPPEGTEVTVIIEPYPS